jgi:hypothetical protein
MLDQGLGEKGLQVFWVHVKVIEKRRPQPSAYCIGAEGRITRRYQPPHSPLRRRSKPALQHIIHMQIATIHYCAVFDDSRAHLRANAM